jgi:GH25 family lysozyme M1 (1,4-beta-N-acetylmuramidase)
VSRMLSAVRHAARPVAVAVAALSALTASALAYADGVDVSHWQGTINWTKVDNDGVQFAFMKATDGTSYTDPLFSRNWSEAKSHGIFRGAYHFAEPSSSSGSAAAQARHFVSTVGSLTHAGDLPPVLDLEATGGLGRTALTSWVSTWLSTVERLTGRNPMIYVSPSFWEYYLGNSTAFHHYPLWVAHYGVSQPRVPGGWPTWSFWQRTSQGHVDGVSGYVDMNRFNGSSAQLAKFANTDGGSGTPPSGGPTLPASVPTTLSLSAADATPAIRQTVTFSGDLSQTSPQAQVAGERVTLWARPTPLTTWTRVGSGTTDADGHYTLRTMVTRVTDYQARFAADKAYAASRSPIQRVTTPPRASVALDVHMNKTVVRPGAALMLYGHLTSAQSGDGVADVTVKYYKRFPHGTKWTYVGRSTSVAPTGRHSIVLHPKVARVWKVVSTGNDLYRHGVSRYLTVRPRG